MENSQTEIKVESFGPIELKYIKLDDKVDIPKDPHMIERNEDPDQLPTGQFTAIKNKTPPNMIEEFKDVHMENR